MNALRCIFHEQKLQKGRRDLEFPLLKFRLTYKMQKDGWQRELITSKIMDISHFVDFSSVWDEAVH